MLSFDVVVLFCTLRRDGSLIAFVLHVCVFLFLCVCVMFICFVDRFCVRRLRGLLVDVPTPGDLMVTLLGGGADPDCALLTHLAIRRKCNLHSRIHNHSHHTHQAAYQP